MDRSVVFMFWNMIHCHLLDSTEEKNDQLPWWTNFQICFTHLKKERTISWESRSHSGAMSSVWTESESFSVSCISAIKPLLLCPAAPPPSVLWERIHHIWKQWETSWIMPFAGPLLVFLNSIADSGNGGDVVAKNCTGSRQCMDTSCTTSRSIC